jgi:Protein of unknown function (DUF3892)
MKEFQITAINKPNRMSPHEHITHIGNLAGKWKLSREEAIRRIKAKLEAFYTVDRISGRRVYIGVVPASATKGAYLRTHADGKWNDNLLALPECSSSCRLIA